MADAVFFAERDSGVDGFITGLPLLARETTVVENLFGFCWNVGLLELWRALLGREVGGGDRQCVLRCELEIAFVMGRTPKNRACAVVHHNEVGDIDGQFPRLIKRVTHAKACIKAFLLGCFDLFRGGATFAAVLVEREHLCIVFLKQLGERVVRRDANKRRTVQSIGACCVNLDPIMAVGRINRGKRKLEPARFADPVLLHQLYLSGPVIQTVQSTKQFLGMIRNLEEPLCEFATLDQST